MGVSIGKIANSIVTHDFSSYSNCTMRAFCTSVRSNGSCALSFPMPLLVDTNCMRPSSRWVTFSWVGTGGSMSSDTV